MNEFSKGFVWQHTFWLHFTTITPRTEHRVGRIYQTLGWQGVITVTRMCDHFLQLVKPHVGSHQWSPQVLWLPTLSSPGSLCHHPPVFKHMPLYFMLWSSFLGEFPQIQSPETSELPPPTFWHPSVLKPPFVMLILRVSFTSSALWVFIHLSVLVWYPLQPQWNGDVSFSTARHRGVYVHI